MWGPFEGTVYRGIRYAFPKPEKHDPEAYFYRDRRIYWYDFKARGDTEPS